MARIPLLTSDELGPEQRQVHDRIVGNRKGHMPVAYRALIHNPELADKWQMFGELLRYRTSLSLRLSELAILLVAHHYHCRHEWSAHEPLARKAGVPAHVIQAIATGIKPEDLQPDEEAVVDYCTDLLENHSVRDSIYQKALGVFGTVAIVELTALLGFYTMVAMTLNAHEIAPV